MFVYIVFNKITLFVIQRNVHHIVRQTVNITR